MIAWGWWRRRDVVIDTLIVPPVIRFPAADEALPARTLKRREAAAAIRRRAGAVETGAPVAKVLTMAKAK